MTPLGVYLRGVLMGAADIVPGVSGGTMAFITGIYDRLLDSIRSFDLRCLRLLWQRRFRAAWGHVDGGFLLALVLGIFTSILSLARLLSWLLAEYPVPLWAFFFGLILASALVLLRQVPHWTLDFRELHSHFAGHVWPGPQRGKKSAAGRDGRICPRCRLGVDVFFAAIALASAAFSRRHHGVADGLSVRFTAGGLALEARSRLGAGQ